MGSSQDVCVEGAGDIYWNQKYWIAFLDKLLRILGDNILQENLFIVLSFREILALTRVCAIIHLSICLPTICSARTSHKLEEYN